MRCSILAAVLVTGAFFGCGAENVGQQAKTAQAVAASTPAEHVTTEPSGRKSRRCTPAGRLISGPLVLCRKTTRTGSTATFWVGSSRAKERLRVKHPFRRVNGAFHGSWIWAAASPDGKRILAQFSGECETPMAFFIRMRGGVARSVSGPYTRNGAPENSTALGWTTDGRAIVFFPATPGCGSTHSAGVFLIPPRGEAVKVASLRPHQQPRLERSLRARSPAAIKRALRGT